MRSRSLVLVAVFLAMAAVAPAEDDPFAGTWKLNPAKSTRTRQPRKNIALRVDAKTNILDTTWETVGPDEKTTRWQVASHIDGKYRPTAERGADAVAWTRVDSNRIDGVYTSHGEIVRNDHMIVCKDGKTFVISSNYMNPEGTGFTVNTVFDKE